jgi:NitT/TauT family transport system ATP-binding protein
MQATKKIILQTENVNKSFIKDNKEEHLVLKDVNLSVYENEIVAFLGKSGAGKSTFLRIIAGLLPATVGSVRCNGEEVTKPCTNMSMVFQTFALLPWLNVFDNVAFGLEARGLNKDKIKQRTHNMLQLIGLSGYEKAYPKELSGGMRQRVGFARALAVEPELLLLDEPFSALDIFTAQKLRQDLINLWQTHQIKTRSMILVTHNVEEAVMLSDRVIVWDSNPGMISHEFAITQPRETRNAKSIIDTVEHITSILNNQIARSEGKTVDETLTGDIAPTIFAV